MTTLKSGRAFSLPVYLPQRQPKKTNYHFLDSFDFLSNVFTCIGLGTWKRQKNRNFSICDLVQKFLFPLVLHISVVDSIIMFCSEIIVYPYTIKENVAFIFGSCMILLMWYSLYVKRLLLQGLLLRFRRSYRNNRPKCFYIKVLFMINILNYFVYMCLVAYHGLTDDDSGICEFYYYHVVEGCEITYGNIAYFAIKSFSLCAVNDPFCILCSILFCATCYRCKILLLNFRNKIQNILSRNSFILLQPNLCREYSDICDIIRQVQEVFSSASFIIFAVNFLRAFVLLALLFRGTEIYWVDILDIECISIPACILCFVVPASAAQVSEEMKKNADTFSYLHQRLIFRMDIENINLKVIESLKDTQPVILTAWEMIEFTGPLIPSVLGSLLTYGLLVVNIDKN